MSDQTSVGYLKTLLCPILLAFMPTCSSFAQVAQSDPAIDDFVRQFQLEAVESKKADWIHWGDKPGDFSNWTNHSNRLIPVYTFGMSLDSIDGKNSVYRSKKKIKSLYNTLPEGTLNKKASYFDQTQLYDLQQSAIVAGKKNIIVLLFDGMDWQTTWAAAIYRRQAVTYTKGRGNVLSFQTYGKAETDFGFCVTSCHNGGSKQSVDSQTVTNQGGNRSGGYNADLGGAKPWTRSASSSYLIARHKGMVHVVTDSAASATSITTGKKTYNAGITVDYKGNHLRSISHELQKAGRSVGVATSVPFAHASPASTYAHNVHRSDYQDISRDLLGLPSVSHREDPLPGLDVVIGCGWGAHKKDDFEKQGKNFVPGNKFLTAEDLATVDIKNGGSYVVGARTAGESGAAVLAAAADEAIKQNKRLLGFFGVGAEHLPYQTADGNFDPTRGVSSADRYKPEDLLENPVLADMATAALDVLGTNEKGFWLMVEAGDVDWANHNNNIDDAIGAVFSGDAAFDAITSWVEKNSSWEETLLIVTADHGHMMTLDEPEKLIRQEAIVAEANIKEDVSAK
jgi:alkaline phosphatase